MNPVDIWTKAIDMTLAANSAVPEGLNRDEKRVRREALRDLADAFDRERDGEIVKEMAKARAAAGGAS